MPLTALMEKRDWNTQIASQTLEKKELQGKSHWIYRMGSYF